MSEKSVRRVLRELATNEDLLGEVILAETPEARLGVLRERGLPTDWSRTEILDELNRLKRTAPRNSALNKLKLPSAARNPDDDQERVVEWVGAIATVAGAAAAAAAI